MICTLCLTHILSFNLDDYSEKSCVQKVPKGKIKAQKLIFNTEKYHHIWNISHSNSHHTAGYITLFSLLSPKANVHFYSVCDKDDVRQVTYNWARGSLRSFSSL